MKNIEFCLVKRKGQKEKKGVVFVEWDKWQLCDCCKKLGSYWVGGYSSLCPDCVYELAKFFEKELPKQKQKTKKSEE